MNAEFTLLESVTGSMQAEIIRSLLESRGIRVMMSQESAGAVFGLGVGPTAEVDILVPQSQHELASQTLEEYYSGALDAEE
jgi:hypothetical protein